MGTRDLLADLAGAGLSVTVDGDHLVIRPASKLTDHMRAALRDAKQELLALLNHQPAAAIDPAAVAWTDDDIARYGARYSRLLRWGWPESDAERVAARLVQRDREADPRVACVDCAHYRPGRCGNHQRADLHQSDVGRDLAALLQRCPGHRPMASREGA